MVHMADRGGAVKPWEAEMKDVLRHLNSWEDDSALGTLGAARFPP